jgi:FecR-like protein/putative zinc finger protein
MFFSHHVSRDLSAYCNGELSSAESSRVAEHLIACQRCRSEFETVKLGVSWAEQLPVIPAPNRLWDQIEKRELGKTSVAITHRNLWRPQFAAIAAAVLLTVLLGGFWLYRRESRPFWEVARLDGTPRVGRRAITANGRLPVGEWLETDAASRAKIDVGTIGHVEIDPNTRVRLLETKPTEHRLELERGRMSAHIWAPPRLFFVDTPSAVAADLGCAYTLEVDEQGVGLLRVTSGWVALQLRDRESMVPAGAACATRPGTGPGTPYFEDASNQFRAALAKLDFEPNNTDWSEVSSLDLLLLEARPRDTLTLWHLLSRLEGRDRERVYERMALLTPPPNGVTREGVLRLDGQMLDQWKDELRNTWSSESRLKRTWVDLWTKVLGKVNGVQGRK